MKLSDAIKQLCSELGVTMAELSRRTNQAPQNLGRKINQGTLSFDEFQTLLDALNVKLDCSFIMPGEKKARSRSEIDDRARKRIKLIEEELELEKKKNQYFADISHDFRTELETISGSITLALNNTQDPEYVEMCLARIDRAHQNVVDYINDSFSVFGISSRSEKGSNEELISEKALAGKKVLIVDDNDINREMTKAILENSGLLVDEAADGIDAVAIMKKDQSTDYAFVLMDIEMPNMDGYEATKTIRKLDNKKQAAVPIIAMSANAFDTDIKKAHDCGMNEYLVKPVDINKLLQTLMSF